MVGNPIANPALRRTKSSTRKLGTLLPLKPLAVYAGAKRSSAWTTITLLVGFVVGFVIATTLL